MSHEDVLARAWEAADGGLAARWAGLEVDPGAYGTGLINVTMAGRIGPRRVIVQRVHPAFGPSVHDDIEAVTSHVEGRGLRTPRLVRTDAGALCAIDREGRPWRVLTMIEGGHSYDRVHAPERAEEAGALVGRFHAAVSDLDHAYAHARAGVHDVAFRRRALTNAMQAAATHPLHAQVAARADELSAFEPLVLPVDATPARHAHGDLKVSNLLFDASGRGLCLVDLDTLARMAWPFEMGDAVRSWCNPRREDEPGAAIELELFRASLRGFRRGAGDMRLDPLEIELLGRGVLTIAVELAMRFLTDALEERYFSFDPARFASRGHHNLARAVGQAELAKSVMADLSALERIARRELAGER